MASIGQLFKGLIIASLFYSFAVTIIAYSMNAGFPDAVQYINIIQNAESGYSLGDVSRELESSLGQQTSLPLIELGALVFYSGNIVLDLILNFITATPQMIGLVFHGVQLLAGFDGYMYAYVQAFFTALVLAMYFIGLIELLTNLRSGRSVV